MHFPSFYFLSSSFIWPSWPPAFIFFLFCSLFCPHNYPFPHYCLLYLLHWPFTPLPVSVWVLCQALCQDRSPTTAATGGAEGETGRAHCHCWTGVILQPLFQINRLYREHTRTWLTVHFLHLEWISIWFSSLLWRENYLSNMEQKPYHHTNVLLFWVSYWINMLEHCQTPSRQVDVFMPVHSWPILSCLWFDEGEALTCTFCVLVLVFQLND